MWLLRKAFFIGSAVLLTVFSLTTLKNVYLFATYEHGRQALIRVSGSYGEIAGEWVGTFDTYECGMDERHQVRLLMRPDSSGSMIYRFYGARVGTGAIPTVYSWESLLPYDPGKARTYLADVQMEQRSIVIEPSDPWYSVYHDTQYAAYRLRGDSLYFAYVADYGAEPEAWGMWFSDQLVSAEDLIWRWW